MLINVNGTNNQAASDRVVLSANPAAEKEVQFNQGEILKGVVREIKPDGTISLLVKGSLVNAASEVTVTPGQHLYLLVDSLKGGQAYLKLITAEGLAGLDDNTLSVNLRSIDVPSNPDTILIARRLLQHDLPVNQQNITEIINAMNMVGGITARNLQTAAFALEHNIPLDKNIFPFIHQFISSDGNLSRLVRELILL
ncbi:MAG: hypothetical protein LBJ21_09160, partial [Acidobacteriota bacterium]|nr:hypothetical protein [Acidobacteriota bacterium]